jgi:hypothetical protein
MRIALALVPGVVLLSTLVACTPAPHPVTPSPSVEQVRLPLTDESTAPETTIPFAGADDVAELTLWLQLPSGQWSGDVQLGASATSPGCRFEQSRSAAVLSPDDDRAASAALLDELVDGRVPLQDPRRVAWGTGTTFTEAESFDLLATLVDDDGFTIVGARVFSGYGLDYRMELHCDELAELSAALHGAADAVSTIPQRGVVAPLVAGEFVGAYTVRIPVDLGAREHAAGETILGVDGTPVSYTVAPDDVWDIVAKRFGLYGILPSDQKATAFNVDTGYLNVINQVRRGDQPWTLYAGDIVNLSVSTITSVGRINGETLDGALPSPLPPQR